MGIPGLGKGAGQVEGGVGEPWSTNPHTTMPAPADPADALAETLLPILFGSAQARPSGRLRPLLVGRPHPRRRLKRWGSQITISAVAPSGVPPCGDG